MASQLLGAQSSLNAGAGVPGAAPTVLQGALVAGGLSTSGALTGSTVTVTGKAQAQFMDIIDNRGGGGGAPALFIGDGESGAAANYVSFQTSGAANATIMTMADNGQSGQIQFDGAYPGSTIGAFRINTTPLRLNTDQTGPALEVQHTAAGAGAIALFVGNGGSQGAGTLNAVGVAVAGGTTSTSFQFYDSGSLGTLNYEGTSLGAGAFALSRPLSLNQPLQSGRVTTAAGNAATVTNAQVTTNSIILVTPVGTLGAGVTSPPHVTINNNVSFTITWVGGNVGGTFSWFIAAF